MRAIKYKYAIALNLSIADDCSILESIEQAKDVSNELGIQVCLTNSFNGKSTTFYGYKDTEEILQDLINLKEEYKTLKRQNNA